MKREDLEKVTIVRIFKPSTTSEGIHLLQALPNLEKVILMGNVDDEDLAAVLH